jgi:glutathione synthase/RimK-type ligase-like ATP-grasp enzyme
VDTFIDDLESTFAYPIIIKDIKGYRGKNSHLVESRDQLKSVVRELDCGVKVMYQEYIPNDYDWGVLVSNGEVVASEKSYPAKGEFRNNACNGATEVFVDVKTCPEHIRQIALKASRLLNLEWSRSDIVVDKNTGEAKLLEVNRYPGITRGTDEVKAVINFLKKCFKE